MEAYKPGASSPGKGAREALGSPYRLVCPGPLSDSPERQNARRGNVESKRDEKPARVGPDGTRLLVRKPPS
jgi:hypothetical protein